IVPEEYKNYLRNFGFLTFGLLILVYMLIWYKANKLTNINIDVEGSIVNIKCGDLFSEDGLKTIPFNEYFDTVVDDKIISHQSLNGIFVNRFFENKVNDLDNSIVENSDDSDIINSHCSRPQGGKIVKFKLSTIFVFNDYIITA